MCTGLCRTVHIFLLFQLEIHSCSCYRPWEAEAGGLQLPGWPNYSPPKKNTLKN